MCKMFFKMFKKIRFYLTFVFFMYSFVGTIILGLEVFFPDLEKWTKVIGGIDLVWGGIILILYLPKMFWLARWLAKQG